jgi:large exoprotein involved in heme utilization and adhesion
VTTIATGRAGNVTIYAKDLEMNNATIQTDTYGDGKAGDVTVTAESLKLNNDSGFDRGIFSNSRENARGDAGSVTVNAKYIDIDGAFISSSTSGKGNAGTTIITSDSMKLANFGGVSSQPLENSEGHGGLVTIDTKQLEIDRSASISVGTSGAGHAGNVMINADSIKLSDKGNISSGAFKDSSGDGGAIRINAKQIGFIESRTDGKGSAGNVMITGDILKITNGRITTSSINEDAKAGGSISIDADRLEIVNGFVVSETYGNGNAGQLSVNTDSIQLLENGFISTSTFGKGSAGNVSVTTNSLTAHGAGNSVIDLSSVNLTGIFSGASAESGGKTGTIEVNVKNDIQLNNGAQISIKNDATVAETQLGSLVPTVINIDTTNLFLTNSRIAADSNGNVDAGSIHIHFADQLFLDPSQISTEAASGNGGSITIQGDGAVFLLDSAITTSVSGQSGNGGDIAIAANGLILDSGFIQANTAASGANGGNVDIKTPALVPSGNSLFVGGNTPFQFQPFSGLNVIQAAAPTGVSGVINTATPQLNLNAMLTNLVIESFDANVLNRDMCTVSESSSLMPSGRGAQPLRARDLLLLPLF